MENLVRFRNFWKNKKVLITGHTGFKGGWLSLSLQEFGANLVGVSLKPPTQPNFFSTTSVIEGMVHIEEDIRNLNALKSIFAEYQPEIVFHLAAQPLVRYSYSNPVETYETNFIGTLNVLECIRSLSSVRSAIMVTSDKCYENKEKEEGYKEDEPMGGHDPYSGSKGAAELLISSYRNSYFSSISFEDHNTSIASVRAGNVIGGGDWAEHRLMPDIISSIINKKDIKLRSPLSIRPWQHVLEPMFGYLSLSEILYENGQEFSEGWNFGPYAKDAKTVKWIVENFISIWGSEISWKQDTKPTPHEAQYLKLDCSKAQERLNWRPILNPSQALELVATWHKSFISEEQMREVSLRQIREFMARL